MSGGDSDSDSGAPEEFTSKQGIQLDEEIRNVQRENKARIVREGKARRRQWAHKLTPRASEGVEFIQDGGETETIQDVAETGTNQESQYNRGMLPNDIVELLASREKQVFFSDSEEEETEKRHTLKKKKPKRTGLEPVIMKDIPPARCLQSSLEFLKKRKMQVSRSSAVLNNSNQALRLLSTSGLLSNKR